MGVAGFAVVLVVVGVLGAGAVDSDVAVGVPPSDGGHLGTGVDVGHDARSAIDMDVGVHDTAGHDIDSILGVALTTTEDVANGVVVVNQDRAIRGTNGGVEEDCFLDACHGEGVDGTVVEAVNSCGSIVSEVDGIGGTADVDESRTVVDGVVHAAVDKGGHKTIDVDTGAGQSTAADDGTFDATAGDGDMGVAQDAASGVVDIEDVAAAADDAAVVLLSVFVGADVGTRLDVGMGGAEHVAVSAAAEGRAIDVATVDGEVGAGDVTIGLEVFVGVVAHALAGAIDVAVHKRVVVGAYGATSDDDGAETVVALGGVIEGIAAVNLLYIAHRGHVAAAVDILVDGGIAANGDVGVAIGAPGDEGRRGTGVIVEGCRPLVATPTLGAVAAAEDGAKVVSVANHLDTVAIQEGEGRDEGADFTATDGDVGILHHHALFSAAVDVAHDGAASDVDGRLARAAHGNPVGRFGVNVALTGADNVARAGVEQASFEGGIRNFILIDVDNCPVVGVVAGSCKVGGAILVGGTYGATGDGNLRGAGLRHEGVTLGVGPPANTGHLAAAEDGAVDSGSAANGDRGVGHTSGKDIAIVVHIAASGAEDVADAVVGGQSSLCFIVVGTHANDGGTADADGGETVAYRVILGIVGGIHEEGAIDIDAREGQTATAVDGALDAAAIHGDTGIASHTTAGGIEDEFLLVVKISATFTATEDIAIP